MRNRLIDEDEFLRTTRALTQYNVPIHGELTKFKQTAKGLDIIYAVAFKNDSLRISHLKILTKWDKFTLTKPINLIMNNQHKKDLYRILKELAVWS